MAQQATVVISKNGRNPQNRIAETGTGSRERAIRTAKEHSTSAWWLRSDGRVVHFRADSEGLHTHTHPAVEVFVLQLR